jgi:hypothetical protein
MATDATGGLASPTCSKEDVLGGTRVRKRRVAAPPDRRVPLAYTNDHSCALVASLAPPESARRRFRAPYKASQHLRSTASRQQSPTSETSHPTAWVLVNTSEAMPPALQA